MANGLEWREPPLCNLPRAATTIHQIRHESYDTPDQTRTTSSGTATVIQRSSQHRVHPVSRTRPRSRITAAAHRTDPHFPSRYDRYYFPSSTRRSLPQRGPPSYRIRCFDCSRSQFSLRLRTLLWPRIPQVRSPTQSDRPGILSPKRRVRRESLHQETVRLLFRVRPLTAWIYPGEQVFGSYGK